MVSRALDWHRENEPLGTNNRHQRCNILNTEMFGIQLRSVGVLKGKLSKSHCGDFYASLPYVKNGEANPDQVLTEANLASYIKMDDHNHSQFIYQLHLDVSQTDIPATSERSSYASSSFNAFISDKMLMKQISQHLQDFVNDDLIKVFDVLNKADKQEREEHAREERDKRMVTMQNMDRFRIHIKDPDNMPLIYKRLLDGPSIIPNTEKALEQEYSIWEERIFILKTHYKDLCTKYWYQGLSFPGNGNDSIRYNRFEQPKISESIRNNQVDLSLQSQGNAFPEIEFKLKLCEGKEINHPFGHMHGIICLRNPGEMTLRDNHKCTGDVVCSDDDNDCTMKLQNIQSWDGTTSTALREGVFSNHVVKVIGFMDLLKHTLAPIATIQEFKPSQAKRKIDSGISHTKQQSKRSNNCGGGERQKR